MVPFIFKATKIGKTQPNHPVNERYRDPTDQTTTVLETVQLQSFRPHGLCLVFFGTTKAFQSRSPSSVRYHRPMRNRPAYPTAIGGTRQIKTEIPNEREAQQQPREITFSTKQDITNGTRLSPDSHRRFLMQNAPSAQKRRHENVHLRYGTSR